MAALILCADMRVCVAVVVLSAPSMGFAAQLSPEVEAAQRAQLEGLRARVASELQLQAYDLIDELVYGWTRQPPLAANTALVLAEISVPTGSGSGLRALLETHFSDLVVRNPGTQISLVHCPACTNVVVHSGPHNTRVGRGYDFPSTLERMGVASGSRHALFLDFEAEGSDLVLRARITRITPELPIVFARTLTTSTASPALLRAGDALKSAEDARDEYLDTLVGQRRFRFPLRLAVRRYATPSEQVVTATPPLVWLQGGIEFDITEARKWVAGLNFGLTRQPESDSTGWLVQTRIARLLTGQTRSLTHPDIYFFTGLASIHLRGTSALAFRDEVPDINAVIADVLGDVPNASFFSFTAGFEFRVRNRIGLSTYVEASPGLRNAPLVGEYANIGIGVQAIGAEVAFWF